MSAALHLDDLSPAESRHDAWKRIERDAKDQALAEVDALEQTPLVAGAFIAWAIPERYTTAGISELHRVGHAKLGTPYAACGEKIPHPIHWLPLSPALIKHMPRCRYCTESHARQKKEHGV